MGFAVEEAIDELYRAVPEKFMQVRNRLAAAAKSSGDPEAVRRIKASRKPTTAAWVVNLLVAEGTARTALADLGERLRQAHAAMDGESIRALTAEQRKLVEQLTGTALKRAGVTAPSATLRDDITSTLQAAIADPDVTARLGRLTRAEQWSGFGDFGFSAAVSGPSTTRETARQKERSTPQPRVEDVKSREKRAAVAAAERAKAQADAALTELQSDLARARLRREDARRRLADAEQALTAAEDAYAAGKQSARDAAAALKEAKR